MEQSKVNIMYDSRGNAVRVQMDFEFYQWLLDQVPQADQGILNAR